MPVTLKGEDIEFGAPVEVAVTYVDQPQVAAAIAAGKRVVFASLGATRRTDADRDRVIAAAVKAGKFTEARAAYWRRKWNLDPVGTEQSIGVMAAIPALVEDRARGVGGSDLDSDLARMYPPGHELNPAAEEYLDAEAEADMARMYPRGHELHPERDEDDGGLTDEEWRAMFGPNHPRR